MQRSAELAALFPPGVIGMQLCGGPGSFEGQPASALRALLTEQEWQGVAHCHERRIRDFVAGRVCAHQALAALGFADLSVLAGADREPLWPPGVSGSITHTESYSAAVVGRLEQVVSLGIDAERIDAVGPDVWKGICTAGELAVLMQRSPAQRARAATLTFAAKEAFYKSQFALVREWLEFDAVCVRMGDIVAERGEFRIEPCRVLELQRQREARAAPAGGVAPAGGAALATATGWAGRFLCQQGVLIAAVTLPALPSPPARPPVGLPA